ncbi:uroporphyrinogen-III C-methyltransferase [Cupriavidus agavae]|uniref:uroporphyrinogen-III C-methyltransferase n=1 Tax=Cupriavidus agavae TaxID=1001822 RepID=A0A4V2FF78_9BURK|nr:uroporphyrinogen-III C-methyltransferase [Cupriavidus agavae]RZT32329.1 uroporphyrinogen-III C-methyltransferase [Cupriavidus agavae]
MQPGKVWLVGVGPGDPELVTVKAARALAEARVWLVDDLVPAAMQCYASPGTQMVPVGKRGGRCSVSQASIQAQTLAHAQAGHCVARVKGGDPLTFGRGGEEAAFLREHGIEVEVVNGISSGLAAAQALGIALTHRAYCHGVTFVTAHTRDDGDPDWRALAASGTTLVIYMGMLRIAAIRDALLQAGMRADMPAAVVMHASCRDERQWAGTLETLAEALAAGLESPAIIMVGEVVAMAASCAPLPHAEEGQGVRAGGSACRLAAI